MATMGKRWDRDIWFGDVIGLVGLLYPWLRELREKPGSDRHISELISELDDPFAVTRALSRELGKTKTVLEAPATLYGQALSLLKEAGVKPQEEDGKVLISHEEIWGVYAHLASKYDGMSTDPGWPAFIHEVRLAVASLFKMGL